MFKKCVDYFSKVKDKTLSWVDTEVQRENYSYYFWVLMTFSYFFDGVDMHVVSTVLWLMGTFLLVRNIYKFIKEKK